MKLVKIDQNWLISKFPHMKQYMGAYTIEIIEEELESKMTGIIDTKLFIIKPNIRRRLK